MKSPLRKRLPRELKGEIGKYLVVLILMIATIGFVSGFLVADGSMIKAYNEGFEKYKIEDGNFRVKKNSKYGVINTHGDIIIPIKYDFISPLCYGETFVVCDGEKIYIK